MGLRVKIHKETVQISKDGDVDSALSSLEVMNTPDDMHCKKIFR
jgi:hypothetical protein